MCQIAIFPRALNEFPAHEDLVKFLWDLKGSRKGRYLFKRLTRVTKGFRPKFQPGALVLFRLGGGVSGCAVAKTPIKTLSPPVVESPETGVGLETYRYELFFAPASIRTFTVQVPIAGIEAAIGPGNLKIANPAMRHATYILVEDCQAVLRLRSVLPTFPADYVSCSQSP